MPLFTASEYFSWQPTGAASERFRIEPSGVSLGGAGSYGGSVGAFYLQNAATIPTSNPSAGALLYASAGKLNIWQSDGTVVPLIQIVVNAGSGLTGGGIASNGPVTVSMPNVGPGAGTIGGSGQMITGITLDVQGRVTAASSGAAVSTTINLGTITVDFGSTMNISAKATVTGQAWVTSNSRITASFAPAGNSDHTAEDALVEDLNIQVDNLVPGVGFDVSVYSPLSSNRTYLLSWYGF